jgi:hypothetical protein
VLDKFDPRAGQFPLLVQEATMLKILSIGAISALAMAAGLAAPAGEARAQVMATPPGCQWLDGAVRGEQELYCRDEDGRSHRTETRRQDMGGSMEMCPRGQMDDGLGCVSEVEARRSQLFRPQYDPSVNAPPPFDWQANKTSDGKWRDPSRPDAIIVDQGRDYDRHGRRGYGSGYRSGYGSSYRSGYGSGYGSGYIVDVPD